MIRQLQTFYSAITTSIAFLPALISLLFLLFSLGVVYVEMSFISASLTKSLEVLMVKGNDNARHVLGALIGGIISLTVFSFSMVMVLLNQASSSFTPRILPGLLTDKKHQFVLGFCIGTIIYCIIIILNIKPGEGSEDSPKFGVLLAMVFGVICLALFIYFIHLISQKLQIDKIISTVAHKCIQLIERGSNKPENSCAIQTLPANHQYSLSSPQTGYLSQINKNKLLKIAIKHGLHLHLLYPPGTFLLKNTVFAQVSSPLKKNDKLHTQILTCFSFSYEPFGEHTYLHGLNQIAEMAVKALSPGINDPGTALIALDHLSNIFCCFYEKGQESTTTRTEHTPVIMYKTYTLQELLFQFIDPISNYGKSDAKVQLKLLEFYTRLLPYVCPAGQEVIYNRLDEQRQSIATHVHSSIQAALLLKQAPMPKTS